MRIPRDKMGYKTPLDPSASVAPDHAITKYILKVKNCSRSRVWRYGLFSWEANGCDCRNRWSKDYTTQPKYSFLIYTFLIMFLNNLPIT